ncbi:MAG: endonuclease/exonuclease/phosphatase family protein [Bacteroidales bacterium]|nr:endonuclease/exonuclease/phosphatase family protein [Bacteroidales bacterium]
MGSSDKKKRKLSFINRLIFLLNLIAFIALLASYTASWISPEAFWPLAFFGLVYPLLFFINLLFVGYWLIFSKRHMLYSLTAIVIGIGLIGRFSQISDKKSDNELKDYHKIMTYNVHSYARQDWRSQTKVKTQDQFVNFFKSENPDIICLQEHLAYGPDERKLRKKIINKTGLEHYYLKKYYNTFDESQCIGLFSRFPIIRYGFEQMNWHGRERTYFIYSDIVFPEDTVRVYSVHLQSNYLTKEHVLFTESPDFNNMEYNRKIKNNSISLIRKLKNAYEGRSYQSKILRKHIQDSPHPVVVCGDFNETPTGFAYGQVNKELEDAYRESGSGKSKTYEGKFPASRIDYIFHDKVLESANTHAALKRYSDHYPVITNIKIRNN